MNIEEFTKTKVKWEREEISEVYLKFVLVRIAALEVHRLFPFFLPDIYALTLLLRLPNLCCVFRPSIQKVAEINLSHVCHGASVVSDRGQRVRDRRVDLPTVPAQL